jgi:hypothetical protein
VGKPERKTTLGRSRHKWEDNIKWQDKGKIVDWAFNAARYLNRNYAKQSGHLWYYFLNNKHYIDSGDHEIILQK